MFPLPDNDNERWQFEPARPRPFMGLWTWVHEYWHGAPAIAISSAERAETLERMAAQGRRFDPRRPLAGLKTKLMAISNAWRH